MPKIADLLTLTPSIDGQLARDVPPDVDLSPHVERAKPRVLAGFDQHRLRWAGRHEAAA